MTVLMLLLKALLQPLKETTRQKDRFSSGRGNAAPAQRSVKRIKAGIDLVAGGGFAFSGLSFVFWLFLHYPP